MNNIEENIDKELLMLRYISGETSAEENKELLGWLQENPDRIGELNRMRATSAILSNQDLDSFSADKGLKNFEKQLRSDKKSNLRKIIIASSSVAALFVLFFAFQYLFSNNDSSIKIIAISPDTVKEVTLSDNSHISLNKKSVLSAKESFNKKNRTVYLSGEAFFDVSHDEHHPFVVMVDDLEIKVLGTAFNVFCDTVSNNVVVTVKRGKVAVIHNEDTVVIEKEQQASHSTTKEKLTITNRDISNSDSWKTGQIIYENTPLQEVVMSLNKNFSTNYEIESPELLNLKLNAGFNIQDKEEEISKVLSIVLGVKIKEENNKMILYVAKENVNNE